MRWPPYLVGAACLCAAAAAQEPGYLDAAARGLVARARSAVLHDRPLRDLRSFVFKGRLRIPTESAADTRDGTVEIMILLPDRYLRVDVIDGVARRSGFAGALALGDGTLADERAQFARFMLGALAYAPPEPPLRLQSTGESAFADTEAVDVTGPAFSARLVFDAASHLPMRIVFFGERQVSVVVSFANRRTVDGIELPFRVTTQTPDRVLETLMFDDIAVNPPLRDEEFRR